MMDGAFVTDFLKARLRSLHPAFCGCGPALAVTLTISPKCLMTGAFAGGILTVFVVYLRRALWCRFGVEDMEHITACGWGPDTGCCIE